MSIWLIPPFFASHMLIDMVDQAMTGSCFEPNYYQVSRTRTHWCISCEDNDILNKNMFDITWINLLTLSGWLQKVGEGLIFYNLLYTLRIFLYWEEKLQRKCLLVTLFPLIKIHMFKSHSLTLIENVVLLSKVTTNWNLITLKICSWEMCPFYEITEFVINFCLEF